MTNQALPRPSRELLESNLKGCQNLGLILDKFAPWGQDQRGQWDLVVKSTVRQRGQNIVKVLSSGEAKGIWLNTQRKALRGETPSLFEFPRTDEALMAERQERWLALVRAEGGMAFTIRTMTRLVVGLGASHVLETGITLERNTGLPYIPGSAVKGLARARGLIQLARALGVEIGNDDAENKCLNDLDELLATKPKGEWRQELRHTFGTSDDISEEAEMIAEWFRFIFGAREHAGAVIFLDAIYAEADAPHYVTDVMTPHYVSYYTKQGGAPPSENDNPNPVSFLAVEQESVFAFGLLPRRAAFKDMKKKDIEMALGAARDWLRGALTQLGAGGKTAAGYGFFSGKSLEEIV